ncbi:SDR family oxidoreductase [Rhodococcus fascians]|uniref:SDR family NAD(P)-dependent oxidoreductase n=1 Tax=Rhodococcoides fascians TaxID=1828 RepID=UPI00050CEB41|nr:SDR family oxidoreductase [Rhodococcus fascians]MDP9635939.1 NAD(P)-dependent dehydrogenase (short-subunit alcohol dehydrogenase family) [Rhodococcus cercidiphylli]MBY4013073.1 SDR family oxidoreductase [Rhodococcus fascians]MBY4020854.1 SDR family oxidoreductase [Rhodococcus fascians]MBY4210064.1 SDR family oxidoreductase [Rhodococcus fascians]MBY4235785.1 SDR family oxidoreductase [Rhodococcus fascians]
MDLDLKGKRAIVSGASRGIGLAIARTLLAEGASVGVCARGEEHLNDVAAELSELGTVFHKAVDVGDADAVKSFVDDAAEALGGIDIVVVNASAATGKGPQAWVDSFNVDLMSLVNFIESAAPHLEASISASVVTISTTSALEAGPITTANSYGALKAAVLQHSSAQARALGPKGIRVNAVSPGPIFFEGGAWETIQTTRPALYEAALGSASLGKLGAAQDVANAVTFLSSPAAGHVTGINMVVDGGFTNRFDF